MNIMKKLVNTQTFTFIFFLTNEVEDVNYHFTCTSHNINYNFLKYGRKVKT